MTTSDADLVWASAADLLAHGVRQWSELPLWRVHEGVWRVDSARAVTAGLRHRPVAETVADTWRWLQGEEIGPEDERASELGIGPEKEYRIIEAIG